MRSSTVSNWRQSRNRQRAEQLPFYHPGRGRRVLVEDKPVMRDVIQKVIASEAEAKHRVQAARSEAERVLSEAQKRAQEMVATARQTARREAEKVLADAMPAAEAQQRQQLTRVADEIERQVSVDPVTIQQVAEAVTRCVGGFNQSS